MTYQEAPTTPRILTMILNNDILTYINLIEEQKDINSASEEEQIAIVSDPRSHGYPYNIVQKINNPSEAVQLAAVQQNGGALKYIKNPSINIQIAALENDPLQLLYMVSKLPKEVILRAILKLVKSFATADSEDLYFDDLGDDLDDAIRKFSKKYPTWEEWPIIKKAYKELKDTHTWG